MIRALIIISSILICTNSIAQISFVNSKVIDESSQQPIAYANIAVLNKRIGTSSNDKGDFLIVTNNELNENDSIIISAIGYYDTVISLLNVQKRTYLIPRRYEIQEVYIKPKEKNLVVLNKVDSKNLNSTWGCYGHSFIIARLFKKEEDYKDFNYIQSINIYTEKHLQKFKFNLRLYTYDSISDKPIENLNYENIIVTTPSKFGFGQNKVEVDISEYRIIFPDEGMIVGLEWIVNNENEYESAYEEAIGNKTIKIKEKKTGPYFSLQKENLGLFFTYVEGKWIHIPDFEYAPAIELILSD
jgi:hypothetical protein